MGLVDYSDSESDSETIAKPAPLPAAPPTSGPAGGKKPFQKIVDRSNPGKIRISFSQSTASDDAGSLKNEDGPPAKRARTTRGAGAFSGFNSFLPPPKNAVKSATTAASGSEKSAPRPGVNLRTSAAAAFSRDIGDDEGSNNDENGPPSNNNSMNLPAPKAQEPSIPDGQKPADEVKLVGKPMMFKPLSVSRKPVKKSSAKSSAPNAIKTKQNAVAPAPASSAPAVQANQTVEVTVEPPPNKKKVSLFSIADDTASIADEPAASAPTSGTYEPLLTNPDPVDAFAAYDAEHATAFSHPDNQTHPSSRHPATHDTLDTLAASLALPPSARRELFGRAGPGSAQNQSARVITFNTESEYASNEALRSSGALDAQAHNPVRAIAPGKHSLRQLVNQVHGNRDALEESFAKGKGAQREAGSRYGWR
ncbi:hypothetical protein F5Y15DRAFT_43453 [Xylariaceae sp. FL0016]|nr:hypothetical protein F5Y15DRAFT_43453 [Xylariaceae sp. FL0016]